MQKGNLTLIEQGYLISKNYSSGRLSRHLLNGLTSK